VVQELLKSGEVPIVLTRSRPERQVDSRLPDGNLLVSDAAERETLEAALEGVDRVVYAAGGLLPAASEREPQRDAELTLAPLRTVLAALRRRSEVSFLYLSSGGTVYGDPKRIPVGEDESTRPRGVYGRLHVRCEREILDEVHEHGLRARILRCSTVYGEGQQPDRGQGVIATFVGRIEQGKPIELFGDGNTIRDYLYVGDLAAIIATLLNCEDDAQVLNVGSGEGTSLLEILRLVEAELGREAEVIHHAEREFEVHRIVLDVSRLRELVTVETTPLVEGIRRTHRWLAAAASEAI
jgi:UDP-glucose 4-epimerase